MFSLAVAFVPTAPLNSIKWSYVPCRILADETKRRVGHKKITSRESLVFSIAYHAHGGRASQRTTTTLVCFDVGAFLVWRRHSSGCSELACARGRCAPCGYSALALAPGPKTRAPRRCPNLQFPIAWKSPYLVKPFKPLVTVARPGRHDHFSSFTLRRLTNFCLTFSDPG
jgi:hypothetical protein